MTTTNETLATLAHWMGLSPAAAEALSVTIEVAARKSGRSESFIVQSCWTNGELRSYLAGICRQVTA